MDNAEKIYELACLLNYLATAPTSCGVTPQIMSLIITSFVTPNDNPQKNLDSVANMIALDMGKFYTISGSLLLTEKIFEYVKNKR
jgi:hypothetical protein